MTHPSMRPRATVPTPTPFRRRGGALPQLVAVALLAALLGGCDTIDQIQHPEKFAANVRIHTILTAVQAGNHMSDQVAICLFYKASKTQCDMKDLDRGGRDFEQWLRKKNINRGIKSFEIVEYWEDPAPRNKTFYFHCTINGKNAYISVEDKGPIKWTKQKDKPG